MSTLEVRDVRWNPIHVLLEVGDSVTITVASRPEEKVVPLLESNWVPWERVNLIFSSPTDSGWDVERRELFI